ncbi:MAG: hypothetical protein J7L89_06125 [Bacteroidales bacterium]|nr:hypothetical protein [Bacteroidales bacterium]
MDAAGQEVSIAREIHIIKAEEQTGLGSILQPADGSVINIPDSVTIVAEVDKKEGNAVTYIKVTNPDGGYRKLKIGNNPDRIYSPFVDVISGGNNTLEITMKDINGIADWSRLLVAPMEELANPVILENYWNNAADLGGGSCQGKRKSMRARSLSELTA